ncbi:MAG TPA: hypothetical protein VGO62_17125, partial [Myxococcota bacterium]
MTDDKRDFEDLTVPVPVRPDVIRSNPTDEADAKTFIGDRHDGSAIVHDGKTVSLPPREQREPSVRVRVPQSFDADIAQQQVAPRPARTAALEKPKPIEVDALAPGDTNQFMREIFAPPQGFTAEADEKTLAAAPVARPEDAESIPTAPIPMMGGMVASSLRDDEPSLPDALPPPSAPEVEEPTRTRTPGPFAADLRQTPGPSQPQRGPFAKERLDDPSFGAPSPVLPSDPIPGDGIERPTSSEPPLAIDIPLEHTPPFATESRTGSPALASQGAEAGANFARSVPTQVL